MAEVSEWLRSLVKPAQEDAGIFCCLPFLIMILTHPYLPHSPDALNAVL